jgi:threonine synthase
MLMTEIAYLDPRSGATYPLATPRWCGDGQAPLMLTPLPGMTRAAIRTEDRSLWRYGAALPFLPDDPITHGGGLFAPGAARHWRCLGAREMRMVHADRVL